MIMTVTFEETGGKTKLTLFASVAMRDLHVGHGFEQGTSSAFDQLAELVAQRKARS
jgi:hypothetical protein